MIHLRLLAALTIFMGLSACSPVRVLAPTPNIFTSGAYPQSEISQGYRTAEAPIFFITDRNATHQGGALSYGNERSSSMAFGASTVAFGKDQNWQTLSAASGQRTRAKKLPLNIIENEEILRFEPTPTQFRVVNGKPVKLPEAVVSYNRKRAAFQDEIREQMRIAGKNEVIIFVHGFNNSFEDGVFSLSDIWHFSGRNGVPIAYSWPAGQVAFSGISRIGSLGSLRSFT